MSIRGFGAQEVDEEDATIEDDDAPLDEEEDDRGSVSLGWVFHAAMSAKAPPTSTSETPRKP